MRTTKIVNDDYITMQIKIRVIIIPNVYNIHIFQNIRMYQVTKFYELSKNYLLHLEEKRKKNTTETMNNKKKGNRNPNKLSIIQKVFEYSNTNIKMEYCVITRRQRNYYKKFL